jgi:hypothetical protein
MSSLNNTLNQAFNQDDYCQRNDLLRNPEISEVFGLEIPFWILQQALHRNPSVFSLVGRHVAASAANGGAAAQFLTDNLREICAAVILNLPDGAVIASHSWREMGAVSAHKARYSDIRCVCHGHWREISTMFNSYIKPYLSSFPYSKFLAELFDFLRSD